MPQTKTIGYILLDLDNTLYSARHGLEKAVSRRVNEYIAAFLKLPFEEAQALRREGVSSGGYGTTLEWLVAEKGLDPRDADSYFRFIHPENEADALSPDPELTSFLSSLDLPAAIMTNSPMEHALRIVKKLGIETFFTSIFDIRFHRLKGKPRADAFNRVLDALGVKAEHCLFVDDGQTYVEGYRAVGGCGVLYDELDQHPEFPGPRIRALREITTLIRQAPAAGG
ncbi:MAG: HAD-IA family hydrolase [Treponema sp.]|jgi:putative hydrolase of the HAD superfamily|nr:HAD-IA family hydrolase [Treponema sp.]